MSATVKASGKGKTSQILIDGDPFPTEVQNEQLTLEKSEKMTTMTTATKSTAKELRRKAKTLGISGWEGMGKDELAAAVSNAESAETTTRARRTKRPASKPSSKSRPASSKKSTKSRTKSSTKSRSRSANAEGPNPFRPGTNLWHITEALIRGGKRSDLIRRLESKLEFNPRKKSAKDFDTAEEIDRRLKTIAYILKNTHGFELVHEGRGVSATIKVVPPA